MPELLIPASLLGSEDHHSGSKVTKPQHALLYSATSNLIAVLNTPSLHDHIHAMYFGLLETPGRESTADMHALGI